MTPIRRILVPVDFSDQSRDALDYAAGLSKAFGATVDALHVYELPVFEPPGPLLAETNMTVWQLSQRNAEHELAKFMKAASAQGIDVRASRVMAGVPTYAIVDVAKAEGYDLIVMGTHGRTGLSRVVIGSVAERVVRHAHCPVLVVRTKPIT